MIDVSKINDIAAIEALSEVTQMWFAKHGLQAYAVIRETENYTSRQQIALPSWVTEPSISTTEAGKACRVALTLLLIDADPAAREWSSTAVEKAARTQVQAFDPVTLAVGGLVLGGLILAARVKKIGPDGVEFYEGIPKELANVLKAGANFFKTFANL